MISSDEQATVVTEPMSRAPGGVWQAIVACWKSPYESMSVGRCSVLALKDVNESSSKLKVSGRYSTRTAGSESKWEAAWHGAQLCARHSTPVLHIGVLQRPSDDCV